MEHGCTIGAAMDVDQPPTPLADSSRPQAPPHPHEETPAGPSNQPSILTDGERAAAASRRAQSVPSGAAPAYTVGFVYGAGMLVHFSQQSDNQEVHPEQPRRIEQIFETLVHNGLTRQMQSIPIREVKKNEAMLVHSEDHWDKIMAMQLFSAQTLVDTREYYEQMSLYVSEGTTGAAKLSCGGVIEASLAVARGHLKKSFAIVRPPGHHAEPEEHMGFCFFNNVAVAARVVQQMTPIKRILILDWDVHHGNGTQRAFNDDPSVLYISLHRYEEGTYYPCGPFGSLESCGVGKGEGYSVNVPWPCAGMGDADYIHAFQRVIMPIAMEFAPELVIISAGFDAAEGDDLGECHVSPAGYAHMTHMLAGLANGKLVVALEGGYNLDSISNSALAVTKVLLGHAPDDLPPMTASVEGSETVWMVAKQQSKYWKSVDAAACEPREQVEEMSYTIPEILKAHRQYYLYTQHNMMEVPLITEKLDSQFSGQIMSTSDLLENETIVLFVHEFGNLRVELESSASCDVMLHNAYLLDTSKLIMEWVLREKFALVDLNLFPKPVEKHNVTRSKPVDVDAPAKQVIIYLWDNFIQLSNAKRVIVLGHGPGCKSVIELFNKRGVGAMKTVKAIIQVLGLNDTPATPTVGQTDELRQWFRTNSLLISSSSHTMNAGREKSQLFRRHGSLMAIDEPQSVKLIQAAMPGIRDFVKERLDDKAEEGAANPS